MKRPYLQFSVPCANVPEEEGPPSFRSVFLELPHPQYHLNFPKRGFFIANGWCNGVGNFCQEIRILQPDKEKMLISTGKQDFELKEPQTPFMAVNLFQIVFAQPGKYWVQVYLGESTGKDPQGKPQSTNDQLVIEYPLIVRGNIDIYEIKSAQPATAQS